MMVSYTDGTGDAAPAKAIEAASTAFPYSRSETSPSDDPLLGMETPADNSTGAFRPNRNKTMGRLVSRKTLRLPDRSIRQRRLVLKALANSLADMHTADDIIVKGNALIEVKSKLDLLWEMSDNEQSETFEEMVAVLKSALHGDLGFPSGSQLAAIESVVARMAETPDIDDQLADELTEELIEGNVNVFRATE